MDQIDKSLDLDLFVLGPQSKGPIPQDFVETSPGKPEFPDEIQQPLPDQIPQKLQRSEFKTGNLNSSLESLIDQNDDLMARLSVQIRKVAKLEGQLSHFQKKILEAEHQKSIAEEQFLILKEKDRNIHARTQKLDRALENERQKAETRAEELNSFRDLSANEIQRVRETSAQTIDRLERRVTTLERQLSRSLKYREKLRELLPRQRKEFHKNLRNFEQAEISRDELKEQMQVLHEQFRSQAKEMKSEQEQVILAYEGRIKSLTEEMADLSIKYQANKNLLPELDRTKDQVIDLENKNLLLARKNQELSLAFDQQTKNLQQETQAARREAKALLIEKQSASHAHEALKEEQSGLKSEIHRLEDQVESLQLLWEDGQSQNLKNRDKIESLQKLNQELSQSLNSFRKERDQLLRKLSALEDQTQEKVGEVRGQMQAIQKAGIDLKQKEQNEKVEKIHSILAEIEARF